MQNEDPVTLDISVPHKCQTPRKKVRIYSKTGAASVALTAYHFRRLLQIVRFLQHIQDVIIIYINIFQAVPS